MILPRRGTRFQSRFNDCIDRMTNAVLENGICKHSTLQTSGMIKQDNVQVQSRCGHGCFKPILNHL